MSKLLLSTTALNSMSLYPTWVLWVFCILTGLLIVGALCNYIFGDYGFDFIGGTDPNGLKRHFFFKLAPYRSILGITICIALGFISSVLIMLTVGGIAWTLLWIVKIICYAIVIIGWILLVVGILCCIFGAFAGGILAIPGGLIVFWEDEIKDFAESCVEWGENLWESFNIFHFAKDLVLNYWHIAVIIVLAPIALFLTIAILWMLFALALRIYDWATTRYYSVHHPCPYCQEDSEPAIYYSEGRALNTQLRPGVYGLFHIIHPETGEEMPTLLSNGRTLLQRRCRNCDNFINTESGIDKHIAMVGGPESGKSALSLTMLGKLKSMCSSLVLGNDISTETKNIVEKISQHGMIINNEFPDKTAEGIVPSLRTNITREGKPPYALYLNDIAGELFQPGREIGSEFNFMYNTTSILFIIDPTTAILRNVSPRMKKWMEANSNILNPTSNIEDIYASVRTYLNNIDRLDKITINFVLVKSDTGYLGNINSSNEEELKEFIAEELGLYSVRSNGEFANERFFAVSTIVKDGNIDTLNRALLEQQNIVLDN